MAWARERPDGGRGFGFTGGHVHWNWGNDNFRKLVLNAIVWTAEVDVPAEGVPSQPPTLEDSWPTRTSRSRPISTRPASRPCWTSGAGRAAREGDDSAGFKLERDLRRRAGRRTGPASLGLSPRCLILPECMTALEAPASLRWRLACAGVAMMLMALCRAPLLCPGRPARRRRPWPGWTWPRARSHALRRRADAAQPYGYRRRPSGRVWVCEVVNYRHRNGSRPEGDRILILEDTDHDGKADKSTVFYQGRDIDSAMGICVLGNRVHRFASPPTSSSSPTKTATARPTRKRCLFSKAGMPQHDHSTHAFVFGPDGKLYWNVGNDRARRTR